MRLVRRKFSPALTALCALVFVPSPATADPHYLQELVQQAHQLALAQHPQWKKLLHYRPRLLGAGEVSEADDPAFFTTANGKYDPQAELDATLAAFFSSQPWGKREEPAQCAFVARFEWLDSQLHFDSQRLPRDRCEQFDKWYTGINPGSLTLVFPSAYINNPSSMFGHTLLRVDPPGQSEDTRLLSYAINYGAETGNDNGVAFALKGIFGGYPGYMGIGPYYKKVNEYSNAESRDIWEYQLNFTPEEIRRLLAHVWELRGVYFEYYFFDENCSYLVLTLLDAARPNLDLAAKTHGWVIPSDTLRELVDQQHLVTQVIYRPAAGTKLTYYANTLSPEARTAAKSLADGMLSVNDLVADPRPEAEKADILLLAHDYLRYEYLARRRDRDPASRLSRELLLARSSIADASPPATTPAPAVHPEQGHNTAMLQAGLGKTDGDAFFQLDMRPAYHDLLDDDGGYVPGAQIDFLNLGLRYKNESSHLAVEHFTLVDIVSLTPRSEFFRPTAWKVRVGWQHNILPGERNPYRPGFLLDGGAGVSTQFMGNTLVYGFLDAALSVDGRLDNDYALGAGVDAGVLAQFSPRWKLNLHARHLAFGYGDRHAETLFGLEQRYVVSRQQALNLNWRQQRAFGLRSNSVIISWRWYL